GMTRVPELLAAGVRVGFGQDCVMDPWYSLGTGDMLDVAHMGLHVAQMTSPEAMRRCYELVTTGPAEIMGLSDYGLRPGALASLIVLDAVDPIEAIRRRPERLAVISKGRVVARTRPAETNLSLPRA
ncbi:MAG: amidohydrolase family protein, partial [Alphaproteobacteria bacterium]